MGSKKFVKTHKHKLTQWQNSKTGLAVLPAFKITVKTHLQRYIISGSRKSILENSQTQIMNHVC